MLTVNSEYVCCATCQYWSGPATFKYPDIVNFDNGVTGICSYTFIGADVLATTSCPSWKRRYPTMSSYFEK